MQNFQFSCLLIVLMLVSASPAVCMDHDPPIEVGSEIEPVAQEPQSTLGIGTEGYGSPVESDRIMSGEITAPRPGYVHPFLSIGGFYTDNLFKTSSNKKSDTVAVITPGIWFALPATRQKLLDVNTLNTAPGGLALSHFRSDTDRRFQGYALYRADIREHDKYKDENHVDHRGEGSFRVNLRGGLSFEIADIYEVNRDPYGTGGTPNRQLDKYKSNLANAILSYQISPKTSVRIDYGNYDLDYDETRNAFRNRNDNSVAAYFFYRLTPKTSLFVQAEHIDVDYDENINSDNEEMNYYLGVQMRKSKKLRGLIRVGYGEKEYDVRTIDDRDDWLAEARLDYFFTPKTSVYLRGSRRVLETDTAGGTSILSQRAQLGYRQRFTPKLRGEMAVSYIDNAYEDPVTIGLVTDKRDDDQVNFTVALGFTPVRWFNVSLGYEYEDRDSNFQTQSYESNTVFLRMTAAL